MNTESLYSHFRVGEDVELGLSDPKTKGCKIEAVHIDNGKVLYDVSIPIEGKETREVIKNIHSSFVHSPTFYNP